MKIDEEYVYNNKLYDIAVRDLKATFFDILTYTNDKIMENNDYSSKLDNLKRNISNVVNSVKELDSFYAEKHNDLDNTLKSISVDKIVIDGDNKLNSSSVLPDITNNEKISEVEPIDYNENTDKLNNNDNDGQSDNISSFSFDIDNEDKSNDVKPINYNNDINNSDDANSIDYSNDSNTDFDNKNEIMSSSKLKFKRETDNPIKVILVSDIQYNKLVTSCDLQEKKLNDFGIIIDTDNEQEVPSNNISVDDNKSDTSENLADKAIKLYKEGKTKEAQELMDKINNNNN